MARLVETIYLGPIKIEPVVELVEGLFMLKDPKTGQLLGYPHRNKPFQLYYTIGHLSTMRQAMIRSRKNWVALLLWHRGKVFSGPIIYNDEENALTSIVSQSDRH